MSATLNLVAAAGDVYGTSDLGLVTGNRLFLGKPNSFPSTVWIPFNAVNLAPGVQIISATLKMMGVVDSFDSVSVKMGFESAINPATPSTFADLTSRVQTTAVLTTTISGAQDGVLYSWNIGAALQELVYLGSWVRNSNMAVLITDNSTAINNKVRYATADNVLGYDPPKLDVVYNSFVPMGGGVV